jgi:flagellin-like protein
MRRKAISGLVGATMLMAVTVSLAGLFSSWAPGLLDGVTKDVNNQTDKRLNCNQGRLDIVSAKYYTDNTTAVVRNTGTIDFNDVQLEAWKNDIPMNKTVVSAGPGNFTAANISTSSKPTSIRAHSRRCGDVNAVFENVQ